ncbi:endonuclease domain-containing protein [Micromonospora pisi]|uniref:endonuclease domain-containing protein n=1 Tax=Micromonospora pisi TaxID=589240 RepID=UPI000EACF606
MWTLYRLRPADWQALWDSQDGLCALCFTGLDETRMAVDHDHRCCPGERSCGRCVRALLCRKCNTNVGWLEAQPNHDFKSFLELLHDYVDRRALRVTDLDAELARHGNARPARVSVERDRTKPL